MLKRDLLSIADLEVLAISSIVNRIVHFIRYQGNVTRSLQNRAVGIYFKKTSTRTRTSFTLGASKLGATPIVYGPYDLQINTGETIRDTARVLSGYLDALVLRTAESIEEMRIFADQDSMAVINAMSDLEHPTQALSDLATMQHHFGRLAGLKVLYLGEGNSTAASFALAVSKMRGMQLTLLTPQGYGLPEPVLQQARKDASLSGAQVEEYHNPEYQPEGVDIVYTTRWQTTGSSKSDPNWKTCFQPFQVTPQLMARVSRPEGTLFMHDLPAVREEDVATEVLDGPQSIAFEQAKNKLFGAMAILEWCLLEHFQ
jgi:ornithine carbamoyltransferase